MVMLARNNPVVVVLLLLLVRHGIANHYHNEMTGRLSHHYTPMTPAIIIIASYMPTISFSFIIYQA